MTFEGTEADQWFIDRQSVIHPKKLHAIGWMMLQWQNAEESLHALFAAVLGVNVQIGRAISHAMGDVALSNSIRDVAIAKAAPETFREEIDHILKQYDICRTNRNFLAHALLITTDDGPRLTRLKGRSGKEAARATRETLDDSLERIRETADDISRLNQRLVGAFFSLVNQPDFWLVTWPERPILPKSLVKLYPKIPRERPRQPQPLPE